MQRIRLGRTGLEVGVAGLGCGGHSRLGLARGASEADAVRVVQAALDLGVDLVDTARAYGTEPVVGRAIADRRERVVLCTKALVGPDARRVIDAAGLRRSLDESLTQLGTDYVDVLHLHGVLPEQYAHCREVLLPELLRLREAGKVRFLGITERFNADPGHRMLERALEDDWFDVVMVGFNALNPSARARVFPRTRASGVGTLVMFAVRRALSDMAALREAVSGLVARGEVPGDEVEPSAPLDFLLREPDVGSLVEAGYRFARHEPGVDVVLTGTGSVEHLRHNLRALLAPPLPERARERLAALFGSVDSISGS